MKTRDELLHLAEIALDAATDAGCDAADAAVSARSGALTRFANNTIHQNVASEGLSVTVRAVRGKRSGVVHTGVLTEAGIRLAGEKAAEIAAASAEDPEFPGIVASPAAKPCGLVDPAAEGASPGERADAVVEMIRHIERGGAVASGSLSTGGSAFAIANTAGTRQFDRHTSVGLNVVAMADTAAGCATFSTWRLADLDVAERAELALRRCLDSRGAGEIEPGEYTVVLEAPAAAEVFAFLGWLGFGALEMQQGRSCLQGKLGQKVCNERITIVDDARDPAGSPFAFDGEGVPSQRVELIAGGVFKAVVYDQKTAVKDKVKSTGHGSIPPNPWGPSAGNLIVAPGDATVEQMIESTERGLLVTNFHYVNIAEPSTAAITGMTRYGLFEIAGGKVARAVKNLRFTQSALAALADVEAVSRERQRFGSMVAPALKVRKFRFTGKSDH